jgi:hypothetical protein
MVAAAGALGSAAVQTAQAQQTQQAQSTRPTQVAGAGRPPNIVFFLVDNLGYGELGCYGGGILRGADTKRIDAFAQEGIKLLNFAPEAQCTPVAVGPHDRSLRHSIWQPHGGAVG